MKFRELLESKVPTIPTVKDVEKLVKIADKVTVDESTQGPKSKHITAYFAKYFAKKYDLSVHSFEWDMKSSNIVKRDIDKLVQKLEKKYPDYKVSAGVGQTISIDITKDN